MDPYRLPRTAVPSRYDIRLEPDLTTLTFRGQQTVALEVTESISELVLNAIELAIDSASLENDRGETIRATATIEEAAERCRLALASPAARGRWRLRLAFRGTLNDKLRGFYRSVYKDPSGVSRTMAATQFEATDARRAFPCWDEPSFKAVFAVTLAIDPALTAVSNTSIVAETLENGRKVVKFADSIVMSTYLVAFVIGELEHTEPTHVGRAPLSVWCVPGKKRLAKFGQEIGAASLAFFARALLARAGACDAAGWRHAADAVRAAAARLTHPIGAALLGDLLGGEGWAALHDLAAALARDHESATVEAARRLTRLGHSSGWDLLAGFVAGARG